MKNEDDDQFHEPAKEEPAGEELPPVTTLHIDVTDKRGIRYQGAFIFKVPNMRDEIEMGRRKAMLLPVAVVNDTNSMILAEMISYLDVTLQGGKKSERLPDWWKPLEFYDATPIVALYEEATRYARRFRGESDANSRADEDEATEGQPADGGGVVDGDVQPSIERRTISRTDTSRSTSASASRRSAESREG